MDEIINKINFNNIDYKIQDPNALHINYIKSYELKAIDWAYKPHELYFIEDKNILIFAINEIYALEIPLKYFYQNDF